MQTSLYSCLPPIFMYALRRNFSKWKFLGQQKVTFNQCSVLG